MSITKENNPELYEILCDSCGFDTDHIPKHGRGYVEAYAGYKGKEYVCYTEWDYTWGVDWDMYQEWEEVNEPIRKIEEHGSIELLSYMGSDQMILETARVCTGAKGNPARDKGLMSFLIRNDHKTPLESCVFRFRIKAPIFVARQWVKHRMSSWNERSARYMEADDMEFLTPHDLRQESSIRGLTETMPESVEKEAVKYLLGKSQDEVKVYYNDLREQGLSKEQARLVMPVGAYTEWIWTVNLSSLANFLKLRTSHHAQKEIRDYANAIYELIDQTGDFPYALEVLKGMNSLDEAVKRLLTIKKDPMIASDWLNNQIENEIN